MSDTPPKKRARLQIHPLTVVLLMLCIGAAWWVQDIFIRNGDSIYGGWPIPCFGDGQIDDDWAYYSNLLFIVGALVSTGALAEGIARRKLLRFQLHLSTCIALMFVAGMLGWVQTVERREQMNRAIFLTEYDRVYGWPYDDVIFFHAMEPKIIGNDPELIRELGVSRYIVDWKFGVPLNIVSWGMLLALVAVPLEHIVRRRERARAEKGPAP